MKTTHNHLRPACSATCDRRSFIAKSICTSLGIGLSSGLIFAAAPLSSTGKKTDEEIFSALDELVDKYFPVFGTCSQTSFYALNKVFNLNADEFVKALASMPGVALRGETCGGVSGSLLAIAMMYEEEIFDEERKRLSREPSYRFCAEFEKEYGSTRCRDVIEHVTGKEYNITKPEDYQLLGQEGVYNHCPAIIKKAVHLAAQIILEKSESGS